MRILTTPDGRVRLLWRLGGFLALTLAVTVGVRSALPGGAAVSGSAALLVGALVAGWCLLALDGWGPGALGFRFSRDTGRESVLGLALGTGLGLAVVLVMAALGGLRWSSEGGTAVGWWVGSMSALLYLAVPAAAEEALVRGYPLQALAQSWGAEGAIVVTGLAFGALHLGNPGAGVLETANIAAAGLLLGVVYVRTSSLWWATGVHLGWNWSHGYIADVPVSGLEVLNAPLYEGVPMGPVWLGGGSFGPEGSVVATVVVLSVSAALWFGPWLRPGPAALAAGGLLLGAEIDRDSTGEGTG